MPAEEPPTLDPEEAGPRHEALLAANGTPRVPVPQVDSSSHMYSPQSEMITSAWASRPAALGLCGPNRRGGIGRRWSKWAPLYPPHPSSSSRHGLCLQVPGLLLPPPHRAVHQGPGVVTPPCPCTPLSAFQSGRLRLRTYRVLVALSSTQLIVKHSAW